jgi:hypothetical protein
MKLRLIIPLAASLLLLTGCSAPAVDTKAGTPASQSEESVAEVVVEPLDLTGEWKQTNSNSDDTYQTATIAGEQISVDWVTDSDSTKAVYWIGSYIAPTEGTESYSWDSQGDVAQMETALMASGDTTKAFTFENDVLSYDLTAMGVTVTVEMSRQ